MCPCAPSCCDVVKPCLCRSTSTMHALLLCITIRITIQHTKCANTDLAGVTGAIGSIMGEFPPLLSGRRRERIINQSCPSICLPPQKRKQKRQATRLRLLLQRVGHWVNPVHHCPGLPTGQGLPSLACPFGAAAPHLKSSHVIFHVISIFHVIYCTTLHDISNTMCDTMSAAPDVCPPQEMLFSIVAFCPLHRVAASSTMCAPLMPLLPAP